MLREGVDTAIVGHALGVMALGGVGATGSVNFLVIGFCSGLCTGMTIPLAQAFGAGDHAQLRRYVAGCVWIGAFVSLAMLGLTLPLCRSLLTWMSTPAEQMDYAFDYIFIIFLGIPATILYNLCACVLRALGDSRSPISLLEMGLYARSGKLFVACSPDYYRYDNVRITCRRYGVPLYDSLTALLDDLPQQSDE